ncbi:MAG: TIGR00269 family protein [Methanomassiliicoccales archaeon]|nr:TIGR00269 family protein [Methanomassiliicoccales archaeon]
MPTCIKCGKEPITFIRYNGSHLCEEHFLEFVVKRVRKEMRRQVNLDGKHRLAVALSGGKDSSVTLSILAETLERRRDFTVLAITVDEGIACYRPGTMQKAEELCRDLGVEHHVIRVADETSRTMDEIASKVGVRSACTYCGVLRRRCMNKLARDLDADVLATGLNLDDTAQSILMNFTRGDVEKLARLGPHTRIQAGLIPRIQPLRLIPEKESLMYAMLRELPFSSAECPYAEGALRNEYREIVDELEDRHPGTRHAIVNSYDAMRPYLLAAYPPANLEVCGCGEPTSGDVCKSCELLEEVKRIG